MKKLYVEVLRAADAMPDASVDEIRDRLAAEGTRISYDYCRRLLIARRGRQSGPTLTSPHGHNIDWTEDMFAALETGVRENWTVRRIADRVGVSDQAISRGCLLLLRRILLERDQERAGWPVAAE